MRHSSSEIVLKKTVYDAGGGAGRANLDFETLFESQCSMYARTVNHLSDYQREYIAQEERQITIVEKPVTIYINVAREDFPDVFARIEIVYIKSASSQAWAQLLKDVCTTLKIDFIHSILDRVDKSPVHRIPRLRPGGDYLVRQRETSAILEVINTGRTPVDVSWGITMDINDVKQSLSLDQRSMPVIDRRVASLVAKPVTRETQREISTLIMNAVSPKSVVAIIEQFHKQFGHTTAAGTAEHITETPPLGDIAKYEDAIDIVSLHRLCLETLGRFVTGGRAKQIASGPCFDYVCNVVEELRSEVDVVTMGLKLLTEVMKYLVEDREKVFHVILNCVQAYAPPESKHRPRNPKRLKPPEDQYSETAAQSPLAGYAAGGGGVTGGAGAGTLASVMGSREARMPAGTHPSLVRYGDFYGHSEPSEKDAAMGMSEPVKSSAGTLSRLKTPPQQQRKALNDVVHVIDDQQYVSVGNTGGEVATAISSSTQSSEPLALIRGRARVDKAAATQALQSALGGVSTAAIGAATSATAVTRGYTTAGVDGVGKANALTFHPNDVVAESEEFVREQEEFRELQKSKPVKYQIKIKAKAKGGGDGSGGDKGRTGEVDNGEEVETKKWKGSLGAIGRFCNFMPSLSTAFPVFVSQLIAH